ncbi:hypothetical protein EGK75_09130 [Neisseria weixii]|uniref:Uncharacterized protein n=1 Tax=Neisseria weixii TaxID=1853276 RepID=A0A3N4N761_9NEIS|nr:hypothetical protein [Neisseria weixii]RPD86274.1 hypothetical protein EGK75_09130 [Neisseria weixii]RPD89406.1 hypothetical protein EGK74_04085 [Neisseria weixii]
MRGNIQAKIGAALSGKLTGATQSITLKRVTKVADKIKGTFTEAADEYQGRGVCRLSWKAQEMAALNIPQTDGKAVILQNEIPVAPKQGDWLDFGDGWCVIINVRQDPIGAAWIVQYRKA